MASGQFIINPLRVRVERVSRSTTQMPILLAVKFDFLFLFQAFFDDGEVSQKPSFRRDAGVWTYNHCHIIIALRTFHLPRVPSNPSSSQRSAQKKHTAQLLRFAAIITTCAVDRRTWKVGLSVDSVELEPGAGQLSPERLIT